MNEVEHNQIAKERIEKRLAQADVLRRALKAEKKRMGKEAKSILKASPVMEEFRAIIENYQKRIKEIETQPDHEQLTLTLAGPDYQELG